MRQIGLMGCGFVSGAHFRAIAATPELELAAVYDPNPARLEKAHQQYGVKTFSDEDAFWKTGFDAVSVCSPAPFHRVNVERAAREGVHVLCEKPLAMDEAEAEDMIRIMERAGLMLFTGYCYRFSPVSRQIGALVAEGAIGSVRSLRLIYIWHCHGRRVPGEGGALVVNARRHGRMIEGGPMVDCGVHQIDLARWWLRSEVARWQAAGAWVEDYDAPDHMYLHMDHQNGAHTMIEMSYTYGDTVKEPISIFTYDLIGSDGVIRYDRNAALFEIRTGQGTRTLPFHGEKGYPGLYAAFANALNTGDPGDTLPTGRDGLIATRIARQATEEAMKHKPGAAY